MLFRFDNALVIQIGLGRPAAFTRVVMLLDDWEKVPFSPLRAVAPRRDTDIQCEPEERAASGASSFGFRGQALRLGKGMIGYRDASSCTASWRLE